MDGKKSESRKHRERDDAAAALVALFVDLVSPLTRSNRKDDDVVALEKEIVCLLSQSEERCNESMGQHHALCSLAVDLGRSVRASLRHSEYSEGRERRVLE